MNVYSCKMSFFRTFQASDKMNHSWRELINKEEKDLSIYSWLGGVILVILKASQENIKTDIKTKSIKCQNVYSPNAPPGNCFRLGISRFIFNFKNAGGWLGTSLCKTFVSLCLSLYFIFHRKQLPRLQLPSRPSLLLHHSLRSLFFKGGAVRDTRAEKHSCQFS